MNILRFGLLLVTMTLGGFSSMSAMADASRFYVVDKCNGNVGTNYPSNTYINKYCAGTQAMCDSGSSMIYDLGVPSTYQHSCGAFNVKRFGGGASGTQGGVALGRYVVCFNDSISGTANDAALTCRDFLGDGLYCNPDNLPEGADYGLGTTSSTVSIGSNYAISTNVYTCCHTCTMYPDTWTDQTSYTGLETRQARTCSAPSGLGSCNSYAYYVGRCKANYYSGRDRDLATGTSVSTVSSELSCNACPAAPSGWSGPRSEPGSENYTYCQVWQGPATLGCDDGEVYRKASNATTYASTLYVGVMLYAEPGDYVNGAGTACVSCPNTTSSYTSSALSTLVKGTSAGGRIGMTACYVPGGSSLLYYDSIGTFYISGGCNYSTSATSGLL